MGEILTRIESIAHCLLRCRIYENHYFDPKVAAGMPSLELLKNSMVELYTMVLTYVATANRVLERNTLGKFLYMTRSVR